MSVNLDIMVCSIMILLCDCNGSVINNSDGVDNMGGIRIIFRVLSKIIFFELKGMMYDIIMWDINVVDIEINRKY